MGTIQALCCALPFALRSKTIRCLSASLHLIVASCAKSPHNHTIGHCRHHSIISLAIAAPSPIHLGHFFMIGPSPAVCIPEDASVSFSSRTITSLTMPAGTDLSFQDHGRAAALEFSIFKRGENGMTGQAVIKPPRANLHHIAWVGYLCVSALPDPTAWQCPPDII